MLLAISFQDPFLTATVHPPLQSVELIHGRFVDLLELVMRGSCLVQDAAELCRSTLRLDNSTLTLGGFVKSCHQQALALAQIVRKKVGVVHHAHCFSDFYE